MSWIDSHCHLDFPHFDNVDALMAQLQKAGCEQVLVPAISARYFDRLNQFQQRFPQLVKIAMGLHPYFYAEHEAVHLETLANVLAKQSVSAVGEIGLDFMLPPESHEAQWQFFLAQLQLAKDFQLPVVLHCRKAHDQLASTLKKQRFEQGGLVHGFSGSWQQAVRYLDLGFVLGIGGAFTHERAKAMHKLVARLPDDAYVLETDSPDMAPSFAKGQVNTPLNIPTMAMMLAQHRQQTLEQVYGNSTANFKRIIRR